MVLTRLKGSALSKVKLNETSFHSLFYIFKQSNCDRKVKLINVWSNQLNEHKPAESLSIVSLILVFSACCTEKPRAQGADDTGITRRSLANMTKSEY